MTRLCATAGPDEIFVPAGPSPWYGYAPHGEHDHALDRRQAVRARRRSGTATSTTPRPARSRPRVALATPARRRRGGRVGVEGVADLALGLDREAHEDPVRVPQAGRQAPARAREAAHARARQGHRRRDRRGQPRPRGDRVRVRHRRPREGRVLARTSRPRSTRYSIRQPLGVVAGITPFNFPAMVPMWMYPIAIACGNTFVLKPSERDPSCRELLRAAARRRGPAARRVQRRPRRQGRRRSPARAPARSPRSRSSARRRSRSTSTRPARSTASACRRSAARRTT